MQIKVIIVVVLIIVTVTGIYLLTNNEGQQSGLFKETNGNTQKNKLPVESLTNNQHIINKSEAEKKRILEEAKKANRNEKKEIILGDGEKF